MSKYNITWFDTETTGLDIKTIDLVSIYAINYKLKTTIDTLINPEVPIPESASNVHGIVKKQVKNKPTFKKVSSSIRSLFESSEYIGGYNICKYDVPLINSLFERNNLSLNIENAKYIDVFYIAKNVIPKDELSTLTRLNLVSVYKYVTGRELDAHKAKCDTVACIEILEVFDDLKLPWQDYILDGNDITGAVIDDIDYIVKFGKHSGKSLKYLTEHDSKYLNWIVNNNAIAISDRLTNLIK